MGRVVFCFIFVIISFFNFNSAYASWQISNSDSEIMLKKDGQKMYLKPPIEINRALIHQNRIYVLSKAGRLYIVPLSEIEANVDSDVLQFQANASIDLSKHFPGRIIDFAMSHYSWSSEVQRTVFMVTVEKDGKIKGEIFSFNQLSPYAEKAEMADAVSESFDFLALKAKFPFDIIGSGKIISVIDPSDKTYKLLTLDLDAQVAVQYSWENPFGPELEATYPLPRGHTYHNLAAPFGEKGKLQFETIKDDYFRTTIADLKVRNLFQRTQFLMDWRNQVGGNVWTEQLLAWGAFAGAVRKLDKLYGEVGFDESVLNNDPTFQWLMNFVSPDDAMDFLKDSGLFSDDEFKEFQAEYVLTKQRGGKWAGTIIIVAAMVTYFNANSARVGQLVAGAGSVLSRFTSRLVEGAGLSDTKVARFFREEGNFSRWLRARMMRNHLESLHPKHLIKKSEKRIQQFDQLADQLTNANRAKIESLGTGYMRNRAHAIMDVWDDMARKAGRGVESATAHIDDVKVPSLIAKCGFCEKFIKWVVSKNTFTQTGKLRKLKQLYKTIGDDVNKLKVIEQGVEAQQEVLRSKIVLLHIEKKLNRVLARAEDATDEDLAKLEKIDPSGELAFLQGDDLAMVMSRIDDIQGKIGEVAKIPSDKLENLLVAEGSMVRGSGKALEVSGLASRLKEVKDSFPSLHKSAADIEETMGKWIVKGKEHPVFDWIANISALHARYFVPRKYFGNADEASTTVGRWVRQGLGSNFVSRTLRHDQVTQADGAVQDIAVKAIHAKTAVYTGTFDIIGDVITQWIARAQLIDPEEHVFGRGDNFLEFIPTFTEPLGIHFDFVFQVTNNAIGWGLMMPMGYARLSKRVGSSEEISLMRRTIDEQIKSLNPANIIWGLSHSYPIWLGIEAVYDLDYRLDHADDFDQEAYEEFSKKFQDRTISLSSVGERMVFNKLVAMPYINPQYFIQTEFNEAAQLIFKTNAIGMFVSSLVMPVTTGFYMHKWWGDYFGFDNPQMMEILQRMNADGVLSKIDENGYTDLNAWTEEELKGVWTAIFLLEMDKYSKEVPFPVDGEAEDMAIWYANLQSRLYPEELADKLDQAPTIIKALPNVGEKKGKESIPFRYKDEVVSLLNTLKASQDGIVQMTVEVDNNKPWVMVSQEPSEQEIEAEKKSVIQTKLESLRAMQERVLLATSMMSQNENIQNDFQYWNKMLIISDAAILVNSFFGEAIYDFVDGSADSIKKGALKLAGRPSATNFKLLGYVKDWMIKYRRVVNGSSYTWLGLSIPYYFWQSDQADAHTNIQFDINKLLAELNQILFMMTDDLVRESFAEIASASLSGDKVNELGDLKEYHSQLGQARKSIESSLQETQVYVNSMLTGRSYRWASVYSDFSPMIMGAMLTWIVTRHTLFKVSKGLIFRMTDDFAPLFLKIGFVTWIVSTELDSQNQQDIQMGYRRLFDPLSGLRKPATRGASYWAISVLYGS